MVVGEDCKEVEKRGTTEAGMRAKVYDLQNEVEKKLPGVGYEVEVAEVKWKIVATGGKVGKTFKREREEE